MTSDLGVQHMAAAHARKTGLGPYDSREEPDEPISISVIARVWTDCRGGEGTVPGYLPVTFLTSARPIVTGWFTAVATRPVNVIGSCARPSWRKIVAESK